MPVHSRASKCGTLSALPTEAAGWHGKNEIRRDHQAPVFGMLAQGSAGGRASPFCNSSIEMPPANG